MAAVVCEAPPAVAPVPPSASEVPRTVELPQDIVEHPHEIEVRTDLTPLLLAAPSPAPLAAAQVMGHEVWLVEGLFSPDECTALLAAAERHGFGPTNYPKRYRGNTRLLSTDFSLAAAVFERLQPVLPATLQLDGEEWEAVGLNEVWRMCKYQPGDRFGGHCDASFRRPDGSAESMLTVNIYMNDGYEGGRTRFYFKDHKKADWAVTPKAGLCVLFRQPPGERYYHDGEELRSGLKYLFRSDVMYRQKS